MRVVQLNCILINFVRVFLLEFNQKSHVFEVDVHEQLIYFKVHLEDLLWPVVVSV